TERMDLQDVINHLRGAPGQKISLTLIRPSTKEVKDYALERAEIKVQSVKGARLLDPDLTGSFKIAYVRLIQFNEPTADELSKALDERMERQRRVDRLRRTQGFAPRNRGGRNNLRKRVGPKCDAVAGRVGIAFHDREVLHPEETSHSWQRGRALHPCPNERGAGTPTFCRA